MASLFTIHSVKEVSYKLHLIYQISHMTCKISNVLNIYSFLVCKIPDINYKIF